MQITVIAVTWAQYMRAMGGAHAAEVASALERDPCGQAAARSLATTASGMLVAPASIVLTVGRNADASLPTGGRFDAVQGFAARVANLTISSSPVALLFGADPDFQYFREPSSDDGRVGAVAGNVGYLLGGMAGAVRKGGTANYFGAPSTLRGRMQGTPKYPGIDRFKDITLKKGTILHSAFPGQSALLQTVSAITPVGSSAEILFGGLQILGTRIRPCVERYAAYEVIEDTSAAFALTAANPQYGPGWLPQIVVPSYKSSLRYLGDFPLGP